MEDRGKNREVGHSEPACSAMTGLEKTARRHQWFQ